MRICHKNEFDIIWSHHFPCLIKLLFDYKIKFKNLIISSLSPYEPLEALPPILMEIADIILVNSNENYDEVLKYANRRYSDKIIILPNSVPSQFFQYFSLEKKNTLKK